MSIEEIREAKNELIKISSDKKQRELYEMRAKILKDKVSALNEAERKGIEKGIKEGRKEGRKEGIKEGLKEGRKEGIREIAKKLLDILDNKTISEKTGLTEEEIQKLRE